MKEIASKDNRIYKECLKLSQKKYRDREGRYLIEGFNLLGEAPTSDVEYVVIREGTEVESLDHTCYVMKVALFDKMATTETSQGVIAVCKKRQWTQDSLKDFLPEGGNIVVLDRLQDPGNIGTIIRTAEGAGYGAVVFIKGTADPYSPKVIRAAAGSVFRIPIVQVEDDRELKELCSDLNLKITVTCLDADTIYYDKDLSRQIALVIGNEGNGVSRELIEISDIRVSIPMEGHLESLNASVAAGILMYEAMRRKTREGKYNNN